MLSACIGSHLRVYQPRGSAHLDIFTAAVDCPPRLGTLRQRSVERLDVPDAPVLEPILQSVDTLPCVDRDAILPGRAAAQHAGKGRPGLGRQLQSLAKDGIAHAGTEIDE